MYEPVRGQQSGKEEVEEEEGIVLVLRQFDAIFFLVSRSQSASLQWLMTLQAIDYAAAAINAVTAVTDDQNTTMDNTLSEKTSRQRVHSKSGPSIATAEEQLRPAQTPPKRFISLEYQRPNDLKPWGVTLQQPQPQEPASDSEDDYSGTLEETHTPQPIDDAADAIDAVTAVTHDQNTTMDDTLSGKTSLEFPICDISARMHCLAERRIKIGQTVTGKYANAMHVSNSIAAVTARPT
ncbi:hypothetical protein HPB50_011168 [Hyalomma asiaticum]|uniref:Uncharacterized protein n=1 Tax=Hyalomma asiaticum TaxID=266040 RepID=A0ACB7TMG6_HYAAI|nr:hypothetical protein HPB50_011168 [Hyalomma asiaticum]